MRKVGKKMASVLGLGLLVLMAGCGGDSDDAMENEGDSMEGDSMEGDSMKGSAASPLGLVGLVAGVALSSLLVARLL